ncbi:MAG: sugar transferase [Saprospiraceae bacterium]|nr:sugar transferase [Saprospiraceae bacterium]
MDIDYTRAQSVFLRTPTQKNLYRRALISKVPASVVKFIEFWVDLNDFKNLAILETSSPINLVNFSNKSDYENEGIGCIINLKRLNDIRFINKFLESANEKLCTGGYFIGCVETSKQREQRIMAKHSRPFNIFFLFFDYWFKRVWPKLPFFKQYYFMLTNGRNRVISEMETYGRLYSCGFKLKQTISANGHLFFVAEKIGKPDYNKEATYGPLIRLTRVGKGGKPFKVYKLRTMAPYSEYLQQFVYERYGLQAGGKMNNDPRVNPLGYFMRKYWIDEMPMLWNLLKGDLKIVGIRPVSQHYLSLYPKDFIAYRERFKPGFIPPFYADLPNTLEEIVASEERYLKAYERYGIITDFRYLWKSLYNVFVKRVRSH